MTVVAAAPTAVSTPNSGAGSGTYSMASLYVGDLHPEVNEAMLFEKFSTVGPVLSIRVCRDNASRLSLGYAYVNFQQPSDAERALDTMNFDVLHGRPMRIMWSQRDPAARRTGAGNIFIKNLDKVIDNKAIFDTFSLFGNILSCKVATDEEDRSKGYGFVHFETEDAALKAIEKVDGMLLGGRKVFVGKFQPRVARMKEMGETSKKFTNVFVKNFGQELDKERLEKMFAKFGTITSCEVMTDGENNSKGFGFVAFENPEDAEKAVADMNDTPLEQTEQKLFVGRAQKKSERQAELRKHHNQQRNEVQQRYQGVNLYVKNLDETIDDDALSKLFEPFGKISSAKIMNDENDRSKGFGFVSFETPEDAAKAVAEMNSKMIVAKPIYVALAQRREDRRAQLASQYMHRLSSMRVNNGGIAGGTMYTPAQGGYFVPNNVQAQRFMPATGVPANNARIGRSNWSNVPGQFNQQQQQYMQQPSGPVFQARRLNPGATVGARPPQFAHGGVQGARIPQRMVQPGAVAHHQPSAPIQQGRPAPTGVKPGASMSYQQFGQNTQRHQNDGIMVHGQEPLSLHMLTQAAPQEQKQLLGERIYTMVSQMYPSRPNEVGKITGMMLEIDNSELIMMLQDNELFQSKVKEAASVLQSAVKSS